MPTPSIRSTFPIRAMPISKKAWTITSLVLAAALVAANAGWAYAYVSLVLKTDIAGGNIREERGNAALLAEILPSYPRDMSADSAFDALRRRYPRMEIYGDTVEIETLSFVHRGGRLDRVIVVPSEARMRRMNTPRPDAP